MIALMKRILVWLQERDCPWAGRSEGDPLQHPELRALSLREIADLPLPRQADHARCGCTC